MNAIDDIDIVSYAAEEAEKAQEYLLILHDRLERIPEIVVDAQHNRINAFADGTLSKYSLEVRERFYEVRLWIIGLQSVRYAMLSKCLLLMEAFLKINENARRSNDRLSDIVLREIDAKIGYQEESIENIMRMINSLIDS
ncbi:MAG: hypothetical protein JWQ09_2986 [Segetibacter sp.]|nr:hypothetical protein [Segetibacter sp.]